MRVLDPRLLERTRGVRALVTLDVIVGVAAALLLLLQATLFAEIVARAFDGAGLRRLTPQLALLALTFAARGAAAVAFEVAGRRAATTVLSDLRLALLQSRLRGRPAAHDGVETAEVAAAAVQGVEGLEAYFGRYLPQLVLACTVPVVVLVFVATVDPLSALIMLLTLPLVPVFMWLDRKSVV